MAKYVRFNENPTKTRVGGLTVKHRKTPQEMCAMDGGPKDPLSHKIGGYSGTHTNTAIAETPPSSSSSSVLPSPALAAVHVPSSSVFTL